jgi:hypothetical protein
MLERLLKFYKACQYKKQSMQLTLEHDKCEDWFIEIAHHGSDTIIFNENDASLNLLCARAYIALERWAREDFQLEDIEINLE